MIASCSSLRWGKRSLKIAGRFARVDAALVTAIVVYRYSMATISLLDAVAREHLMSELLCVLVVRRGLVLKAGGGLSLGCVVAKDWLCRNGRVGWRLVSRGWRYV